MAQNFSIFPIGVVHSDFKEPVHRALVDFSGQRAEIEVFPAFVPGIDKIEIYKTLLVIFYFNKTTTEELLVHPRGDMKRNRRGVFTTCSPNRPNHIGLSRVQLLERRGNRLLVQGLDAIDGTPVLDLHPDEKLRIAQTDI